MLSAGEDFFIFTLYNREITYLENVSIKCYTSNIFLEKGKYKLMNDKKLTEEEAQQLLTMLKVTLQEELIFPTKGKSEEFEVEGNLKKELFAVKIFRGSINNKKYNFGARILKKGILLLELHINPSNVHINPDGTKIKGSHWHIYTERYGRTFAIEAEDIEDSKFVENTIILIIFLNKFNIIKRPNVIYQEEII